jgi:sugar lactone lactonase YvrE
VSPDGTLRNLKAFVQRGGESATVDSNGNVYVANGQIFVYSPAGKQIAQIDAPERPLQLIFGGADRKTLFILAHHALFAAQVR